MQNRFLERNRTRVITARLPGGRECSTRLNIIDDDCKFLICACTLQVITDYCVNCTLPLVTSEHIVCIYIKFIVITFYIEFTFNQSTSGFETGITSSYKTKQLV